MMRDLEDGKIKWLWIQVTNPFQSTANNNHWLAAARKPGTFLVASDAYPGISAKVSDLILPSAMIFEKWGGYGNSERRTQLWRQQVPAPGDAKTDVWQMLEFSKRFKLRDVWGEQPLPGLKAEGFADGRLPSVLEDAAKMGYTPETARSTTSSSRRARTGSSSGRIRSRRGTRTRRPRSSARRGSPKRRSSRSTRASAAATGTTSRRSTATSRTTCAA